MFPVQVIQSSESVSMTEKIIEDNEVSEVGSIFRGIHWQ